MDIIGQRILIFGDSLTHHGADNEPEAWNVTLPSTRASSAPGDLLASMLLERGAAAVRTNARVGRSASNFWGRERAGGLLAADLAWRPTKVIVMLGTNDLDLSMTADGVAMARIRDAFPNVEVWSIGPPWFPSAALLAQTDAVYNMLRQVFGPDRVIDARPLTPHGPRTRDGVHFQPSTARELAANLAAVLAQPPRALAQPPRALASIGPLAFGGALVVLALLFWRRRR
jgi:lysophospholipase L1-like esterase